MNARGMKLICRQSYTAASALSGSPFDYPLSSRLDENDTILVLDKVLIPWENVFIYGDLGKVSMFTGYSGFNERAMFHGCTQIGRLDNMKPVPLQAISSVRTSDVDDI